MLYVDIFEFNQFNIYTFRNRLFISDFCWLFVLAAKMVPTIRFLFPLFLVCDHGGTHHGRFQPWNFRLSGGGDL